MYNGTSHMTNPVLSRIESFVGTSVMSFQVEIGSLDRTVFFQVGLCTPLRTMLQTKVPTLLLTEMSQQVKSILTALVPYSLSFPQFH